MTTQEVIYDLRTRSGLSQDELAEKVFVTHLAAAVHAVQLLVVEADDVAHAIRLEAEVAGIHFYVNYREFTSLIAVNYFVIIIDDN